MVRVESAERKEYYDDRLKKTVKLYPKKEIKVCPDYHKAHTNIASYIDTNKITSVQQMRDKKDCELCKE